MKYLLLELILTLNCLTSVSLQHVANTSPPQYPALYARVTFTPYSSGRSDYQLLAVQVTGVRGGKLSAEAKFKLAVTALDNKTSKAITAIKFSCYIFNSSDQNEVLETQQTPLITLDLAPYEHRRVDIPVLYVDDVPLLSNTVSQGRVFSLEVAASEVHYDDGSIWQGKVLPQKLDPPKTH